MNFDLQLTFHKNGSFTLAVEGTTLLEDCFPSVNGRSLRVLSVEKVDEQTLLYQTAEGAMRLSASREPGRVCLKLAMEQYSKKLHRISLIGNAVCCGLKGIYQAAGSMGAPCGYLPLEELRQQTQTDSSGVAALRYDEGYLFLYAEQHDRFENTYTVSSHGGKALLASAGYRLEEVNREDEVLPTLYLEFGEDLEEGLNRISDRIGKAMNARLHQPPANHWCSWYYAYSEFDQIQLEENLKGFRTADPEKKLQYIQIDAGYSSRIGDWLSPRWCWPKGLQGAFQDILDAGYLPGIWVGIFMIGNRSELAQKHPDWLLKGIDGKPVVPWIYDNEPKLWGYQDEVYYILDTSHPDALEYVRQVFRTLRQWGARLFKTDFMLWGYQDSTKVQRHTPGKTSVEYFRQVLDVIREEIGEDSYWLGCIAPYLPFIGYADGMRIGGDVGSSWNGDFSPKNMIRSVQGNVFTNHAYYQIDPDAMLLRDFHIRLEENEIRSLALYSALSGGCVYTSDPMHLLPEKRLGLFHFLEPDHRRKPHIPFLDQERKEIAFVHTSDDKSRALLFLFNPTDDELFEEYDLDQMGCTGMKYFCEFGTMGFQQPLNGRLTLRTPAHGSHLLLVSVDGRRMLDNQNLWSNLE